MRFLKSVFFNDEVFQQMRKGSFLINVTRGEIVDDQALQRALDSGHIRGAGLDVHTVEPMPTDHPFWNYENVVMTPHTAGASQLRSGRNINRFIENIGRWQAGEPLLGVYGAIQGPKDCRVIWQKGGGGFFWWWLFSDR